MTRRTLILLLLLAAVAQVPCSAADWSHQGADAGMSKYTPDNIPADAALQLRHKKRFHGRWTAYGGSYFYAYNIVTQSGQAAAIAEDRWVPPAYGDLALTKFDFRTGQTLARYSVPFLAEYGAAEGDSHHFSASIVWHDDGRIYARRGGDHPNSIVMLPDTGQYYTLSFRNENKSVINQDYNNLAFMQVYKDLIIRRYQTAMTTVEFDAGWISPACFVAPNDTSQPVVLGQRFCRVGPTIPVQTIDPNAVYGSHTRYCDMPKCAADVSVIAAQAYGPPGGVNVWLQATDLRTGQNLWHAIYATDNGGLTGFSDISDFWRFMATESGHYVFFTRAYAEPIIPTVRVLDLRTGRQLWSRPMTNTNERPLFARHGSFLYVIGRAEQLKLDIATGNLIWRTTHSFPHDEGYKPGEDPLYRPAVLTDDTIWFVDGDLRDVNYCRLVGLRTSDGQVARQLDLAAMCNATPGESLRTVHDLVVSDGWLGVLVGIKLANDSYVAAWQGIDLKYQDLCVFEPVSGAPNNPPVAQNGSAQTYRNTPVGIALAAADADYNVLNFTVVSGPSHGSLGDVNGKFITYTPAAGFIGLDSFTFKANDGFADSNVATVTLDIKSANAPVAQSRSIRTAVNTPTQIAFTATDADGDVLSYAIVTGPSHGTLDNSSGNTTTYTPVAGYTGTDSFTFKANDGALDSNVATVSILVSLPGPFSVTFQNGVSPNAAYAGCHDTWLGAGASDGIWGLTDWGNSIGTYGDLRRSLIKFDVSAVPDGAVVMSAKLRLKLSKVDDNIYTEMYQVMRSWNRDYASWKYCANGVAWTALGCGGAGSDRAAAPLTDLVIFPKANLNKWLDIGLPVFLVQGWVDDNIVNGGLLFKAKYESTKQEARFDAENHVDVADRPILEVTYTWIGDFGGDGHVDMTDLLSLVNAFGSLAGDPNFDPACDPNYDGAVDVADLLMMVDNWGR